jgi:heme A synthase
MKLNSWRKSEISSEFHSKIIDFFKAFWKIIVIWTIIVLFIIIGLKYDLDKNLIGGIVLVFGLITQAFVGLISIISLVPIIGPLVAQVLALPLFWLINALGYIVSIIAIKKGYSKDILNYRVLTIVMLIGVVIGYILGKFL